MKTLMTAILLALSMHVYAQTVSIASDLSGSNPLLVNEVFAKMAGQYAGKEVAQLKNGDTVRLLTFGARGTEINFPAHTVTISNKNRAKKIARKVAAYIASVPSRVTQGQPKTNIVSFLKFTSGFDCANGGKILLITDGLEASGYVSPSDFMSGKKGLPEPDINLEGCELFFYGLGVGKDQSAIEIMRKEWQSFAQKAGATYADYIPN